MAQIPTPPASRHGSPLLEDELKELKIEQQQPTNQLQVLDELLERYLYLLDQHQKLQADLGARLSSGFISLAHANYTCPPGRRYGADYYDERMKATRRVKLQAGLDSTQEQNLTEKEEPAEKSTTSNGRFQHTFSIEPITIEQPEDQSETDDKSDSSSGDETAQARDDKNEVTGEISNRAVDSAAAAESSQAGAETDAKSKKAKKRFRSSDPIYWYGILVPLSLRSAQKSFTEAVEGQISELANVVVEMRTVEKQVQQVRSALGQA
ncbi:uncharacterized protein BO97DRAFT_406830 [Aspergillus homomorphus CBS 101889]|uniref:Vacuolar ATPase assembly protein VMA22 n=1 Tax=Aspergillus homomorphus (strain CBS 101889) TaxID=1450537 RepID=A0A395HRY3_ASPHC|nr:hypothetical protein BO97DRAFT_406830 [Aspergillus homomorphus CBS 101889]RAL10577.1 hypothetical protein BO97DRAFT_406830 [Aspergillus homomorphus CBS 101889]